MNQKGSVPTGRVGVCNLFPKRATLRVLLQLLLYQTQPSGLFPYVGKGRMKTYCNVTRQPPTSQHFSTSLSPLRTGRPYLGAPGNGYTSACTRRFWTDRLYSAFRKGDGQAGWMKEEPPPEKGGECQEAIRSLTKAQQQHPCGTIF